MTARSVKEVLRTFVQWTSEKDGLSFEEQWEAFQDEKAVVWGAFAKLVALARDGVRESALEEAAAMIEVLDWKEPNWQCAATEIRAMAKKGAA